MKTSQGEMLPLNHEDLKGIEIGLLLEGVFLYAGFDFRAYDKNYLKEKVLQGLDREKLETVSALQDRVLHDSNCMERFLESFSIGVPSLFYEPRFFSVFRKKAVGLLKPLPLVKIWVAGCANGAETYSLAILLHEQGLQKKVRLYSTYMNQKVLEAARAGMIPAEGVKGTARNYRSAGGKKSLSAYYTASNESISFSPSLQREIVWAQHNLVTDASFNQFHCILCRNVLSSFSRQLKERVHKLLYESLTIGGLLGLGAYEDLDGVPYEKCYERFDDSGHWFRKIS